MRHRRAFLGLIAVGAVVAATIVAPAAQGAPRPPSGGGSFVRVNQVGYPAAGSKRAYLMTSAVASSATFAVRSSGGTTVFTAPVGADLGSWSASFGHVYALDFDAVTAVGTYTIDVSGPVTATSPSFRIDTGANVYAGAMASSVRFYQVQRDGPDFIPSALRQAPAHLNDQNAMTYLTPRHNPSGSFSGDLTPLGIRMDASGGWFDAGDYVKFLQTTSYTVAMQLSGVRDFPAHLATGPSDISGEARHGTDWMLKMWDDDTKTLYYQVGIGSGNAKTRGDHDIWRMPEQDDTWAGTDPVFRYIRNRPVFRAGPPGSLISPNLAGRTAAAFALCYQIWRTTDPARANDCLQSGLNVFELANTAPTKLLTVIPFSFYPETEWRDDLELAAAELYLATAGGVPAGITMPHPASHYLQKAADWANAYIANTNGTGDTLNLYDVSGFAHGEVHKAITLAGNPAAFAATKSAVVADLKLQLDNAIARAADDPFQFGFPWDEWDTTTHGTGLSVMASLYGELTGSTAYSDWSHRWLSNVLGANAWGVSLIIGNGSRWTHCPQHQIANIVGSLNGGADGKGVLVGASVEGPNGTLFRGSLTGMNACPPDGADVFAPFNGGGAKFVDNVESFSTTEPAVDLTATSPLAFARQAAGLR